MVGPAVGMIGYDQSPLSEGYSSVLSHKHVRTCGKGLRGKVKERGGVDAVASSTTNDKEIVRNPFAPFGLGRDSPDLCVIPRRYYGIDSSSRLDFRAVALPTSVNVFMTQDTSKYFAHAGALACVRSIEGLYF